MNPRGDAALTGIETTRREVILGGMALGALFLAGCQNGTPPPGTAGGDTIRKPTMGPATTARPAPAPPATAPTGPIGPVVMMPRSAWTSAGVSRNGKINPMNGVKRITVHHDGMTPFTSTSQADAAQRLSSIRTAHLARTAKDGSRWVDIGYHYIIDPSGRVWEGRSTQYQGAHVQDNNENNLGIMVMGNYDRQTPNQAQKTALDRFIAAQMRTHRVPLARVRTHQEINPTACPGRSLQAYMVMTRARGGGLAVALADDTVLLA